MATFIRPMSEYHLIDGIFVPKSRFAKFFRIGLAIGLALGSMLVTSTTATSLVEPYTWAFTKTKYTEYIQQANKEVSDKDAEAIVKATFKWAEEFEVSPELILAVAKVESRFDKHAISSAGAVGLMQVLYKVHLDKLVQAKKEIGTPEMFSIEANIYTGTKILKSCMDRYGNLSNALSVCYNGGDRNNGYDRKVLNEVALLRI